MRHASHSRGCCSVNRIICRGGRVSLRFRPSPVTPFSTSYLFLYYLIGVSDLDARFLCCAANARRMYNVLFCGDYCNVVPRTAMSGSRFQLINRSNIWATVISFVVLKMRLNCRSFFQVIVVIFNFRNFSKMLSSSSRSINLGGKLLLYSRRKRNPTGQLARDQSSLSLN